MKDMHLRNFDLNLLVIFDVIMRERSVAIAGERLNLSASAVSHALSRLRRQVGDRLFIREPHGMRPTPRALELSLEVQHALGRIARAITAREFDAARSGRTFAIAVSDYTCTLIVPQLASRLSVTAPESDLWVVPMNRLDIVRQLEEGRVDLAVAWFAAVPGRFGRTKLWDEDEVLVVRSGHPLLNAQLTVQAILSFPHVVVDYFGNGENLVDGFFSERGVLRRVQIDRTVTEAPQRFNSHGRVALKVPTFANALSVLACSDMIASIPRRLMTRVRRPETWGVLEIPFKSTPVAIEAIWHQRTQVDPGVTWLRSQVVLTAAEVEAGPAAHS